MTNDVESFSIPLNTLDAATVKAVYEVGLPRLLDLYARHDIKCTFYFTGMFAEQSPQNPLNLGINVNICSEINDGNTSQMQLSLDEFASITMQTKELKMTGTHMEVC
jgi:hypothetical protein